MKKILFPVLMFFLVCYVSFSQGEKELSLEECIVRALEKNLNVAVEQYNPELADVALVQAKSIFMPQFDLGYFNQQTENPSYWWLEAADTIKAKYADYSLSMIQKIPTGGNFTLSLNSYKSDTNQGYQLINPRYGSTLQFDFTQPLLRDFGFRVARKDIIVAQNNLDISHQQFKSILMETIYSVQEAYWSLAHAIENLKVKQQSLQLGRDLLEKNRKEVEVGKLAPLEILNAEAEVASREADILQAEALVRRSEDVLMNVLNLLGGVEGEPEKIVPLDKPAFVPEEITFEDAWQIALENRPELRINKKTIETNTLNLSVAKNQMLPGLDFRLSLWSPGISGDRILYEGDDPFFGEPIGKEKGSAVDSLRDAFKVLYRNWSVGLTLSIPISNVIQRTEYVRARMELEKSQLEMENIEKQIFLEVKDAVRDIETNAERVEAYRIARELALKRLEAEEKKLNVGLTTNYFVLQYQEQLADARSMEIRALIDYNLALAKLDKVVGISLAKRNIRISQSGSL
jgi:outer membrane protein TolC